MSKNLCSAKTDFRKKYVDFGSDGTAVMTGRNNRVAALLKIDQLYLQSIHYIAHRLELAFKDAIRNVQLYNKLSEFLLSKYTYCTLPLVSTELEQSQGHL